jgi:hypothetical protein
MELPKLAPREERIMAHTTARTTARNRTTFRREVRKRWNEFKIKARIAGAALLAGWLAGHTTIIEQIVNSIR